MVIDKCTYCGCAVPPYVPTCPGCLAEHGATVEQIQQAQGLYDLAQVLNYQNISREEAPGFIESLLRLANAAQESEA